MGVAQIGKAKEDASTIKAQANKDGKAEKDSAGHRTREAPESSSSSAAAAKKDHEPTAAVEQKKMEKDGNKPTCRSKAIPPSPQKPTEVTSEPAHSSRPERSRSRSDRLRAVAAAAAVSLTGAKRTRSRSRDPSAKRVRSALAASNEVLGDASSSSKRACAPLHEASPVYNTRSKAKSQVTLPAPMPKSGVQAEAEAPRRMLVGKAKSTPASKAAPSAPPGASCPLPI